MNKHIREITELTLINSYAVVWKNSFASCLHTHTHTHSLVANSISTVSSQIFEPLRNCFRWALNPWRWLKVTFQGAALLNVGQSALRMGHELWFTPYALFLQGFWPQFVQHPLLLDHNHGSLPQLWLNELPRSDGSGKSTTHTHNVHTWCKQQTPHSLFLSRKCVTFLILNVITLFIVLITLTTLFSSTEE